MAYQRDSKTLLSIMYMSPADDARKLDEKACVMRVWPRARNPGGEAVLTSMLCCGENIFN